MDTETTADDTPRLGAITTLTTLNGDRIEMRNVDSDVRKEWLSDLKTRLLDINGLTHVSGGGFDHQNHQSAILEIEVEHQELEFNPDVRIRQCLRSLSHAIRSEFKRDPTIASFSVLDTPTSHGNATYDSPVYRVDVWFR